jgi:hypothetical protein
MTNTPHIIGKLRALAAEFTTQSCDNRYGSYFDGMRNACRDHAQRLQQLIAELEEQQ